MRHTNRTYDIAIVIAVVALALLPFAVAANVDGFVANKGQIHDQFNKPNPGVLFLYTSPGLNVQLKQDGFAYDAYSVVERPEDEEAQNPLVFGERPSMDGTEQPQPTNHIYHFHRVDIRFVGGDPNAAIITEGESADYSNHYTHVTGEAGATYVRSYTTVTYMNVWPNVDVRFNNTDEGFKYDVIVRPGGELSDVRFKVEGAEVSESLKGRLFFTWTDGSLEESIPDSWLENGRKRSRVNAAYAVNADGSFGFAVKERGEGTLVIDPSPIIWGTYLGGTGIDEGRAVALSPQHDSYVAGYTTSVNAMATAGTFDATYNAGGDAYVAKFAANGTRVWGTYFGGSAKDEARGVALAPNGDVVMVGITASLSGIATTGAFQTTLAASQMTDGLVARFNSSGLRIWSTYFGGSQGDELHDVRVASDGTIGFCGHSTSHNAPTTLGTADPTYNGGGDALIALFTGAGARLWCTYLGGNEGASESARGIAFVDGTGLVVGGEASSATGIATATPGVHDHTFNGIIDGFLARYDLNGAKVWCTFLGGSGEDRIRDVDHVGNDQLAVCGSTGSTTGIATLGSQQPSFAGGTTDGMLAVFSWSNGSRLWGSYHGSSGPDVLWSLESAENGHFCVGGGTLFRSSPAFVADYRTDGVRYYQPVLTTSATHCAVAADPDLMVATGTTTHATGLGYAGVHQTAYGGNTDAFLFRLHYAVVPVGMAQAHGDPIDNSGKSLDTEDQAHPNDPGIIAMEVLDVQGRTILPRTSTSAPGPPWMLGALSTGLYMVVLHGADGTRKVQRIVVDR